MTLEERKVYICIETHPDKLIEKVFANEEDAKASCDSQVYDGHRLYDYIEYTLEGEFK